MGVLDTSNWLWNALDLDGSSAQGQGHGHVGASLASEPVDIDLIGLGPGADNVDLSDQMLEDQWFWAGTDGFHE